MGPRHFWSLHDVHEFPQQLIGDRDRTRIGLEGALGDDHVGELLGELDVGFLEKSVTDVSASEFAAFNGALLEWLHSPIQYLEVGSFARSIRALAPQALNPTALCYHYSHMARRNAREYLLKDQVRLKKYFYVLRPLLAIRFIQQNMASPPVEFEKLVERVAPEPIRSGIARLLDLKRSSPEIGLGDPVPEINEFIESEMERHGQSFKGPGRPDVLTASEVRGRLNQIFQTVIRKQTDSIAR